MPCVSGGLLAGGTSACGLRPAAQPAPTGLPKTISLLVWGWHEEVEEGQLSVGQDSNVLGAHWPGAGHRPHLPGRQPGTPAQPLAPGKLRGPWHPHSSQAGKLEARVKKGLV